MLYDKERWEPKVKKLDGWQRVLLNAADLIEQTGWAQGAKQRTYQGQVISYCTIGAIRKSGNIFDQLRATHKLRAYLRGVYGERCGIVYWNDWRMRSWHGVVEHIRRAAKQ